MSDPVRHGALPDDIEDRENQLHTRVTLSDAIPRLEALERRIRAEVTEEISSQREANAVHARLERRRQEAEAALAALLAKHPERGKLKVYRFSYGPRSEAIVATTSKQKAAAAVGETPGRLWQLTITGNAFERLTALRRPGVVFINDETNTRVDWKPLKSRKSR